MPLRSNNVKQTVRQGLVSGRELQRHLDVCDRTVARMRAKGLPAVRVGSVWRYELEAVWRWLDAQKSTDPKPAA